MAEGERSQERTQSRGRVDTVNLSSAMSTRPAFWAGAMIGASPVAAVRFSSSKEWDTAAAM